ncbi:hypothetical protein ACLK2D_15195 [Escherichia coli]
MVVVACDKNGNIDLTDLRAKAEQAGDNLSLPRALSFYPRRV